MKPYSLINSQIATHKMPMTVYDQRRENLRSLIKQWDGPGPLATKLGYSNASFLVQMAGPNPSREVTEKTARAVEQKLDLPALWLDTAPKKKAGGTVAKRPAEKKPDITESQPIVDNGLFHEAIRLVGQTAEETGITLAPSKLADVVTLIYDDAKNKGSVRLDYVQQILHLLR